MADLEPQSVIDTTVGPLVTGIMIGQLLLGIVCVQATNYYINWGNDPLYLKSLVGVILFLNILLGVIDYQVLYRAVVLNYGNYDGFDLEMWTMWSEPGLTAIVGFVCQLFFVWRVYRTTTSKLVAGVLFVLTLFALGSGLSVSISFWQVQRFSKLALIPLPISLWLISTTVVDFCVASVLVYVFLTKRKRTAYHKTRAALAEMIQLSMETSAATAIIALLNLILYFAFIQTAYHLLPQFSMCRMYSMTVLVTLASRDKIRSIMHSQGHATALTVGEGSLHFGPEGAGGLRVNVTTTTNKDGVVAEPQPWNHSQTQSDLELERPQSGSVWEQKAGVL